MRRFFGPALGAIIFLIGAGLLFYRSVISPHGEVDFRFFWLAGKLWADGVDPYSPAFMRIGDEILPSGNWTQYWFYPPQWWVFCRLFAITNLDHAVMGWRIVTSLLILTGVAALVASLVDKDHKLRSTYILGACGFAAIIEPTPNLIAYGQSSGLVFLSMAAFTVGILKKNKSLVSAAIFLATFKPQYGAPMILAVLLLPGYRTATILGLFAAGLFCLPQIVMFGPITTLSEFLSNSASWSALPGNTPLTATGPAHLLARLGIANVDLHIQMTIAGIAMLGSAWILRNSLDRPILGLLMLTASVAALIPLHTYDFTIIVIPIILYIAFFKKVTPLALVMALVVIRPGKIETAVGMPQYGSSLSAGAVLLTLSALVLLAAAIRYQLERDPHWLRTKS